MKKKRGRQWLSLLLAASMAVTGFVIPAKAAPEKTFAAAEAGTDDREVNFNGNWKFNFGDEEGAEAVAFDDSSWEDEQLPHDFSITQEYSANGEAESGFLPGGTGWYRKTFTLPKDYQGKTIVLNFDGVYNHAYVYVNGEKLGENHYGYNDFAFDISGYVTCDGKTENVVAVKVVHNTPSSRWYSGSGIYRDVKLVVTDRVHVAKNGTYVTTPNLESQKDGNVTVKIDTKVQNDSSASVDAIVRTSIVDAAGTEAAAPSDEAVTVDAEAAKEISQDLSVNKPKLWNCETPNLYYVKTEILVGGTVKDTYKTTFGFRYIKFDPNTGFSLNGENVKLKGVCMHHDQGALGSAAYRDAIYRQVEKLKEMGCNAIRTSHSTPADILLDACNELGVMVMDETYDGWEYGKNGNNQDFSTHFIDTLTEDNQILGGTTGDTWYKFVLESNIERDKNDPSVIMWDIGNELNFDVPDQNNYVQYAENMINYIKAIDHTRPITSGDNYPSGNVSSYPTDFRNKITKKLAESGGIAGMNYSMGEIANVHNAHPDWTIVATETVSPSNSRGIYSTTGHYGKAGDYQCTAYDTDWVSWGNSARESWWYTIKDDFVSGEFIWTGFDYIGEPTPWNGTGTGIVSGDRLPVPNSSYFGVIDTAGFPKDSFYFYTSQWREDATTLHVVPQSWNEEDLAISNGKVPVYVYSNAAKVELYLNDERIGTATRYETTTAAGHRYATYYNESNKEDLCTAVNEVTEWKRMAAQFSVTYQEGTLRAKAYNEKGEVIEETIGLDSVTTNSDRGTCLKVTPEKTEIQADGSSLCYISAEVTDSEGRLVSSAENNIRFSLNGNGVILGVDNGNPSTIDKFQQSSVLFNDRMANIDAFSGMALVIVRSTEKSGGFSVQVQSAGMPEQTVVVDTVGAEAGEIYLKDFRMTSEYVTYAGEPPVFDTEIRGIMSDGTRSFGTITWDETDAAIFYKPGVYWTGGTAFLGGQTVRVMARVSVEARIVALKNHAGVTAVGAVPVLPEKISGVLADGSLYGSYRVDWEEVTGSQFSKAGEIVPVKGTAVVDGEAMPVSASIRVTEAEPQTAENIANKHKTLTESCSTPADKLTSIVDGTNDIYNDPQKRWTNWNDYLLNPTCSITFTWDEVQRLDHLNLWYFGDANVSVPKEVVLSVSEDGKNYHEVSYNQAPAEAAAKEKTVLTFHDQQDAKGLRISMTQQAGKCVGLTECEVWTPAYRYDTYSTAQLAELKIDGQEVEGFAADQYSYRVPADRFAGLSVEARGNENAAVTVIPADSSDVVRILVQAENHAAENLYTIQLTDSGKAPDEQAAGKLADAVTEGNAKKKEDYTAATYAVFETALKAAQAVAENKDATNFQVEKAFAQLQKAMLGLTEKEKGPELPDSSQLDAFLSELKKAEALRREDYTEASYAKLAEALEMARKVWEDIEATAGEIHKAETSLRQAAESLEKKPAADKPIQDPGSSGQPSPKPDPGDNKQPSPQPPEAAPKTGSVHSYNGAKYKVTKTGISAKDRTVTYMGPEKKNRVSLNIPATVRINGAAYKVTAIANKACRNNRKLKKVTVGKNVRTIGASAFAGDAKLKSIIIKSSALKSVGKKALKGVHAKCKIKVPKKKWKAYTRLFRGRGQKTGVKIVK